jgi:uncharacterized protein YjbI with pentapeptide repeats
MRIILLFILFLAYEVSAAQVNANFVGIREESHIQKNVSGEFLDYAFSQFERLLILDSQYLSSNFHSIKIEKFEAKDSNFTMVDFSKSKLLNSNWQRCSLNEVNFRRSDLKGAVFDCVFIAVNLSHADLRGSDFEKSFLGDANLYRAIFNHKTKLPFAFHEAIRRGMIERP